MNNIKRDKTRGVRACKNCKHIESDAEVACIHCDDTLNLWQYSKKLDPGGTVSKALKGIKDIRFYHCGVCNNNAIPVDTTIIKKQQVCKCHTCHSIYKFTVRNKKLDVRMQSKPEWQKSFRLRNLALRVELDADGFIVSTYRGIKPIEDQDVTPGEEKLLADIVREMEADSDNS